LLIEFRTRKLEKCYSTHKCAVKEFGTPVAQRYIQRINIIKAANDLDDLINMQVLRCHALTGNRKGQYAINLTGFSRLIFTMKQNSLSIIRIEEVSKHYDD